MVMGEGKAPSLEHLRALGAETNLRAAVIDEIIEQTLAALSEWPKLAKEFDVKASNIRLISNRILSQFD